MKNIFKTFQIVLICILASCSSDDKVDIKGAVSVFEYSRNLEIDGSVKNIEVKIPKQIENKIWFGSNKASQNLNIENFAFPSKITNKDVVASSFKSFNEDKTVFKPVIAGQTIYTLNNKGYLIARDLKTYKKIYKTHIFNNRSDKSNFINGKIYYNNGKIFATSGFNYLAAIDANNGEIIWSKKIGSIPVSSAIANKDKVFVITADNRTYALNAKDGSIKWIHKGIRKNTSILGAANPVLHKNYLLASYSSGEIYLLKQNTGQTIWLHELNLNKAINSDFILNDIDATPIIKNNVVYTIGNGGLMMAISLKDGNSIWNKELSSISDFWVAGDFIYLINNENQLICLHKKAGKIKWYRNLTKADIKPKKKPIFYGLIMAGDNLILSNSKEKILVISPISGEILQEKKIGKEIYHTPIIVDKKLYVHSVGTFTTNLIFME